MKDTRLNGLIRGIASAPLSFGWLLVLFVTTWIQRSAGRRGSKRIQRRHSTNLWRLNSEPSRVLAASLFWLDGRMWWPYVPMFVGVVAPAERRLRWWRWLLVGSAAHAIVPIMHPSADQPRSVALQASQPAAAAAAICAKPFSLRIHPFVPARRLSPFREKNACALSGALFRSDGCIIPPAPPAVIKPVV